jgi:hypothetical protein
MSSTGNKKKQNTKLSSAKSVSSVSPAKSVSSVSPVKSVMKSFTSMMDIDSIHIILLILLVVSNLYYYSIIVNRNIDYNDEDEIKSLQKIIGLINLFVGLFLIGVIIIKIIQQKMQTKKAKLVATIIISLLGLVPIIIYLIQIVNSFQNKNNAYNLLVKCRSLLG